MWEVRRMLFHAGLCTQQMNTKGPRLLLPCPTLTHPQCTDFPKKLILRPVVHHHALACCSSGCTYNTHPVRRTVRNSSLLPFGGVAFNLFAFVRSTHEPSKRRQPSASRVGWPRISKGARSATTPCSRAPSPSPPLCSSSPPKLERVRRTTHRLGRGLLHSLGSYHGQCGGDVGGVLGLAAQEVLHLNQRLPHNVRLAQLQELQQARHDALRVLRRRRAPLSRRSRRTRTCNSCIQNSSRSHVHAWICTGNKRRLLSCS